MKCYNHEEKDACSTCSDCSRGLCKDCTEEFELPICTKCNNGRFSNDKVNLNKTIVISLIWAIFWLLYWLNQSNRISEFSSILWDEPSMSLSIIILWTYVWAWFPWGWNFISGRSRIEVSGWFLILLYYFVKFIFATFCWIFILPFILYKQISSYIRIRKFSKK